MSMRKFLFITILSILAAPSYVTSQSHTIYGFVLNKKTGEPLFGANVFLDRTLIGTTTDNYGNFNIKNIPEGNYTLVVTYIGYKPFKTKITIPRTRDIALKILMVPDPIDLKALEIEAEYPDEWWDRLKKFKRYFLGISRNAKKTKIINPTVLRFREEDGKFIATAPKPLKIKNKALGYHITFFLEKFIIIDNLIRTNGSTKYSLLEPNNKNQLKNWKQERKRAYKGSYRHFINSLVTGSLRSEGFRVTFDIPYSSKVLEIKNPYQLWKYVSFNKVSLSFDKDYALRVKYLKEIPEQRISRRTDTYGNYFQLSEIDIPRGKVLIDLKSGAEIAPYRAVLSGYWGWSSRIPDLLPTNYEPAN